LAKRGTYDLPRVAAEWPEIEEATSVELVKCHHDARNRAFAQNRSQQATMSDIPPEQFPSRTFPPNPNHKPNPTSNLDQVGLVLVLTQLTLTLTY